VLFNYHVVVNTHAGHHGVTVPINPLERKGNYSATSNNMKLVLADGWAVTFGTMRRVLGGAAARPGPSSLYQM